MNSITITGNLGKDSELRRLPNGDPVCSFSVADSLGKDKPTIWWSCALWGKRGESLQQYLVKGQQVTVVGNVTEREWTDKDGQKRKSFDVRVNDLALQGGRKDGGEAHASAPAPTSQKTAPAPSNFAGPDDGDDIPFATSSMYYDMTTSKQRRMGRYDY